MGPASMLVTVMLVAVPSPLDVPVPSEVPLPPEAVAVVQHTIDAQTASGERAEECVAIVGGAARVAVDETAAGVSEGVVVVPAGALHTVVGEAGACAADEARIATAASTFAIGQASALAQRLVEETGKALLVLLFGDDEAPGRWAG